MYWYSFKVTPKVTGVYEFSQVVRLSDVASSGYKWTGKITYIITVVDLTNITIPSTLSLKVGDTYTFSPVITDSRAETTLTWSSSNTSVVTVANGKITAKAVGTATIFCTASNGVSAQCVVTVSPVLCTGVTMSAATAELTPGATKQLTATVAPTNATNKSLKWATTNANIATVSGSGLVTAVAPGTCNITATTTDGSNKSATCTVTVKAVAVTGVTLSKTEAELFVGWWTKLGATVAPANATNKAVVWSSSNSMVAQVDDDGYVTAVAPGQCDITAKAADGSNQSAACRVNVPGGRLYAENVVGVPSGTLMLPLLLKNAASITGLQFELQLPEGVTVATDGAGQCQASMTERAADQSIIGSRLSNGNYQFVVFSGTSAPLSGSEGVIAYVTLNVDAAMALGEHTFTIKEVELTEVSGASSHHGPQTATLTLTQAMTGDVNGDSKVTVTDAVGIVNYILQRPGAVFISKAADVNGDGEVTISDAVGIINIILNK